jgi:excisionase family DNA binding protein
MFLEERLLSTQELAEYLGMSTHWVWKARKTEGLPAIKMGARNFKYRPSEVHSWLDDRSTMSPAQVIPDSVKKRQKGKVNLFE